MATKVHTKVYFPESRKVAHKVPGSVPASEAVEAARQEVKEQIVALQEILNSREPWPVEYSASGPADEVVRDGGDVTFTSED